jgi:hypothetical protein
MSEIQAPEVAVLEPRVYDIPAYRRELLDAKVAKANARLERAGVAERFSPQYESYTAKKLVGGVELPDGTYFGGTEIEVERYRVTLAEFGLAAGDYTFIASLVPEEAGITLHVAPGQSLGDWRPAEFNVCDHCGLKRNRNRVYVVRNNETGELSQVGHNCIELYTGLSIKGLWALELDFSEFGGSEEDDDWGGGGFGRAVYTTAVDKVLAYAYVLTDEGRSYASTKVREWGGVPTVDKVRHALYGRIERPREKDFRGAHGAYLDACKAHEKLVADIKRAEALYQGKDPVLAAIRDSAETLKPGSEYADNMAVILKGENVSTRNVGILASLVAVYARENQLRIEREKAPAPVAGFLGEPKQRIRNFQITLKTVRFIDGHYGMSTLLIGHDAEGRQVKWFASGRHDYNEGDVLTLEAATVKRQIPAGSDKFTRADTTEITRGVIDTFTERAEHYQAYLDANDGKDEGVEVSRWNYTTNQQETYTLYEIDRWFGSAKEKKRFAAWQKDRAATAAA